jgi:hypothetical protein
VAGHRTQEARLWNLTSASLLSRMTFNTLKRRNIAEVHWMLKWRIRFMANFTLVFCQTTQIYGMLE